MISIVIADDEKLIRAGISKIIRTSIDVPLEIHEAKNGQEALELCHNEHPDVLITDIRMPIMDGVELMKNLENLENKPSLIVLSGFDDFMYAKAAIEHKAMTYILKPVDKKELISAVQQAISQHRNTEQKRNEQTLKSIMVEGRINSKEGIENCSFPNGFYCLSVMGDHCKKTIERAFSSIDYYSIESKKDYECIVIPKEGKLALSSDISLNQLIIGVSNSSDNLSSLRILKKQSAIASYQYFFQKNPGVYYYIENSRKDFTKIDQLYEQCVSKLQLSSPDEVQQNVMKLFDFSEYTEEEKPAVLDELYSKICSNLFSRYPSHSQNDAYLQLKGIMIENICQAKNLKDWKNNVLDYMIYLSELLKKDTVEYPFIEEALDYIKANFSKNINMSIVANQVSVNYTYFSEKFKEHTGINFNEYLKKLRIEEACHLLEQDCYRIYEVAEKSGFGDVKYFTKTFKECTGASPSEWKKLHT